MDRSIDLGFEEEVVVERGIGLDWIGFGMGRKGKAAEWD